MDPTELKERECAGYTVVHGIVEDTADDTDSKMTDESPHIPNTRRRGSLAAGDVQKYRFAFDEYDLLHEGRVCCQHLQNVVTRLGYRIPQEKIQQILAANELGEKDEISFAEFLDLIPRNTSELSLEDHRLADLRGKFQQYDMENKGVISLQEAQWALQVELKVTPPTAFRLLNQFIRLNYDQFTEFYGKIQEAKLTIYDKFGKYDQDRDGMVSVEEAHEVLQQELGFSQARSEAMIQRFDSNNDGMVSYMEFAEFYIAVEEKKARIRKTFHHFDADMKGHVSIADAEQIMKGMLGFSDERCRKAIELYDRNKEGKIIYEDFVGFYTMLEEERDRLLSEFARYDVDADGRISLEEFKRIMTEQGYTDEEIGSLMTGYDLDKDGFLSFDEFKMFLNFRD